MEAIPWKTLERLGPEMRDELRSVIQKAAKVAAKVLPKSVDIAFNVTNPRAVEWIRAHAAELVEKNIMAGSQDAIRDIMRRSFVDGIPPREAARMIREYIGLLPRHANAVETYRQDLISKFREQGLVTAESDAARLAERYAQKLIRQRAEVIARNETMVASNRGQRELWRQGVEQEQLDQEEWERRWIVTDDDRLCDLCVEMDGSIAEFPDGDYKGGSGGPPLHVQCLPGDARVLALRVTATSERWYDGDLIVIHSASGKKLSCTPNHPIATDQGWVAAHLLNVGSRVFCGVPGNFDSTVISNNENVPAAIHDIAKSFRNNPQMTPVPVPTTPEDFHGDGVGSKVAIIRADCKLLHGFNSILAQHRREAFLRRMGMCNPKLPGKGRFAFGLESLWHSLRRFVRRIDLAFPLRPAHLFPFELFGFALVANGNLHFDQTATDGASGRSEPFSNGVFGNTGAIKRSNLIDGQRSPSADGPALNAALLQSVIDEQLGGAEFARQLSSAAPSDIFVDEVVDIDVSPFRGHVYNLQTESGIYVAEGIITHNCRCVEGLAKIEGGFVKPTAIKARGDEQSLVH